MNMIHLRQPNRWTCLPTSFAMVLNITFEEVMSNLCHDGSEIVRPSDPEPNNRKGFIPEEFIHVCDKHGFWCVPCINTYYSEGEFTRGGPLTWILDMIDKYNGVMCGQLSVGKNHAVAWNQVEQRMYDPKGFIYPIDKMKTLMEFWAVVPKR